MGIKKVYFDKLLANEPYIVTYREDNNGEPIYDWEQVDLINDKILAIGMKPFIMISAIPKALASDQDNTNFDGGNSSPPVDYKKWKNFCKEFIYHLIDKYGEEEIISWYFQIMEEPDIRNLHQADTRVFRYIFF